MKTEETNQMKVAQSLVLANFSTTAPSTTRLNRSASARAIAAANAGANAARTYNTVLNSKGTAVGRAISIQQQAGVAIRRLGLPCPMGGIYLRVKDVTHAQNIFDDAVCELDVAREDILATYPDLVAKVTERLGDFVSEVVIPNASTVASRFTMRLVIVNQPVAVNKGVLGGLTTEVANRLRADSQRQITDMLRAAHAGPVEDMRRTLAEFSDRLRNAERLHLSQFDKLRSEAKRLTNLNILGLPELDELIEQIAPLCQGPAYVPSGTERVGIAAQAEAASKKADDTLAALGL
jgi:hypothetical protein|tara:strand:+ start:342 stop:1220 length:879 start_codon:yes stop_codon:yes gene_type:complete